MTNKKILSHEWLVSKMLENPEVKAEVEQMNKAIISGATHNGSNAIYPHKQGLDTH